VGDARRRRIRFCNKDPLEMTFAPRHELNPFVDVTCI
jgi:hypothetical protein